MAKGPEAFRTISEAADELNVPQHVLRFWETRFSFIRPMKRAGGRRFYRPQDIRVLHGVRRLLHDEGHSIKDVQRLHRERGVKGLLDPSAARPAAAPSRATARRDSGFLIASLGDLRRLGPERLAGALEKLQAAKQRLDAVLHQA